MMIGKSNILKQNEQERELPDYGIGPIVAAYFLGYLKSENGEKIADEDIEITASYPVALHGETAKNLEAAARGEHGEWSLDYPEFAKIANLSSPNAAYKVNNLMKKGYLEKIQSKEDKREYHLYVTQKYVDYYNISYQYLDKVMNRLEERFTPQCTPERNWYTVEGGFYFKEGDWHYLMYSGNCYEQPTYYIGYARAKTDETDLTKIKFEKYPDENTYHPVMKANDFEEGTGHHSMIKEDGQWYAIYHARDYDDGLNASAFDARNARICKLNVEDGIITAERYKDHI